MGVLTTDTGAVGPAVGPAPARTVAVVSRPCSPRRGAAWRVTPCWTPTGRGITPHNNYCNRIRRRGWNGALGTPNVPRARYWGHGASLQRPCFTALTPLALLSRPARRMPCSRCVSKSSEQHVNVCRVVCASSAAHSRLGLRARAARLFPGGPREFHRGGRGPRRCDPHNTMLPPAMPPAMRAQASVYPHGPRTGAGLRGMRWLPSVTACEHELRAHLQPWGRSQRRASTTARRIRWTS